MAKATTPLRYDPDANEWDAELKMLQRAGFTFELIARRTGLTPSQVAYRCCNKTGFSFAQHRRGRTAEAMQLMQQVRNTLRSTRALLRRIDDQQARRGKRTNAVAR